MNYSRNIIIISFCLISASIAFSQNPKLFFSQTDIDGIKNTINLNTDNQMVWNDVRARAYEYQDINTVYYFNTTDVKQGALKFIRSNQWPILAGRVLSAQCEALGPVYWLTGESKYGVRGKEVFLAFIRQLPVNSPQTSDFIALARGELMRGLAQGYDWFSPLMTDSERIEAAAACRAYVEYELQQALVPAWYVPYSNWTGVAVGGAGMLALAISDEFPNDAPAWIGQCKDLINGFFENSFGADGEFSEHGYIEYAMVNVSLFADALFRYDGTELFANPNFAKSTKWLIYEMLPGASSIESRNDTGYPKSDGIYAFAQPWGLRMAKVNNDGFASYIWRESKKVMCVDFPCAELKHSTTAGYSIFRVLWVNQVAPVVPSPESLPTCKFFARRGLSIWRTGWTTSDIFFSIESGQPFPVTHDQADAGSFNLYAFGHQWAVDAGYGNLKQPDDRSQGASHNIVQIDGKSQALAGAGLVVGGVSRNYEETATYAYVLCDATEGYNYSVTRVTDSYLTEHVQSDLASGAEKVLRHSIYVKPSGGATAYFVLFDDIVQDSEQHMFKWQMLTDPQSVVSFEGKTAKLAYLENCLVVKMNAAADGRWKAGEKTFTDGRQPATFKTIEYETTAANPYFAAVLIPVKGSNAIPQVYFYNQSDSTKVIVEWENRVDTMTLKHNSAKPEILMMDKTLALDKLSIMMSQWMMCSDPQIVGCVRN